MQDAELIRMANQIADFFQPYEAEEAIEGVATHIKSFWEPRMRTQLFAIADSAPDQFSEPVRAAIARLRH
jgi:formate dehydrogenase subunit delta|tara:strand:+ start:258 stop:467 length:210 start_codon:yes stop_codon:yes gene_type:complete